MKVIDLLNKIANGEIEPNTEFYYKGEKYKHIDSLFESYYVEDVLNNEVEIIDNKIEKIEAHIDIDGMLYINGFEFKDEQTLQIIEKINEIIDKIEE